MADWSLALNERVEALAPVTCAIGGAHTKGAWSQATAATGFQYEALNVDVIQDVSSGGGECFLVDVGVGAAGSEVVIVPNMLVDSYRSTQGGISIHLNLPIQIRAGVRLAVRCQNIGGAGTRIIRTMLTGKTGGANYPKGICGKISNYGAVSTGDTNGTLVDQGATFNTWGAWTQIAAATSAPHNFLQAVIGNNKSINGNSGGGGMNCEYQIAVGASGAEQVIAQGMWGNHYATGNSGSGTVFRPHIPEGSRLAVRTRASLAAANDRNITFILLAG